MGFMEVINALVSNISSSLIVEMIKRVLKFDFVSYLETNPIVKSNIERFIYIFYTKFYFPFFSYIIPLYGILYSLFAEDYNAFPRFTSAYIACGLGLISALTFSYLKKQLVPPQKPMNS